MNRLARVVSLILSLASLMSSSDAHTASCCGGGATFPTLITGDFRSQISIASSYGHVVGDTDADGLTTFRKDSNLQDVQGYKLEGSYQLSDYWQAGASLPYFATYRSTSQMSENSNSIGDMNIVTAYEFLPAVEYSPWKPRGFSYLKIGFPTGISPYESNTSLSSDLTGSGFYSASGGLLFVKNLAGWDFESSLELTAYLPRAFDTGAGKLHVAAEPAAAALIGAGYSPAHFSRWRMGAALAPHLLGARALSGSLNTEASSSYYWDTSFILSFMPVTEWMAALFYLDETLMGPAQNATLLRSGGILIQRRWNL